MSAIPSPESVLDFVGEHGAELIGERDRERPVFGRELDPGGAFVELQDEAADGPTGAVHGE